MILSKINFLRTTAVYMCLSLVALLLIGLFPHATYALNLTDKKVAIGDSAPSALTSHIFSFTIPGYDNIGSIEFEYCSNTPFIGTACDAPTGLSVDGAALTAQTGETGFAITQANANRMVIGRSASATSPIPVSYSFNNIVNPDFPNAVVYVRISTFASGDASGPRTDSGAVVFATNNSLAVRGYVPPYMRFCVGITVALNCTSTNGSLVSFGELSPNEAKSVTSQFSGSTNDPDGYVVSVLGTTMTSGNNIIHAMNPLTTSQPGRAQFGMNLKANSSPGVGSEPEGVGTTYPVSNMAASNQFYFANGVIALSNTATDYKRFTASYVVNVPASQPPGIYSTTLTYVAVATF